MGFGCYIQIELICVLNVQRITFSSPNEFHRLAACWGGCVAAHNERFALAQLKRQFQLHGTIACLKATLALCVCVCVFCVRMKMEPNRVF